MVSDLVSALILAVVQGLTEWIPVSSSGHLVLFESILGFNGGLLFNVALHFGTLMAVFVYFGKDIVDIIEDFLKGKWRSENGRMGLYLIVATLPAVFFGVLLREFFEVIYGGLGVVALGFGITGLFLMIASLDYGVVGKFGYGKSLLIGIAQALSLVPGISRSGATISSGVLLGLDIKKAARFSFLMSIPVIFGANILAIGNSRLPGELIWATLVSFLIGLLAIHVMMKFVLSNKKNLRWFAAYALILAVVLGVRLAFS
jgi:undecaprenyl-diphosphatase